MARKSRRRYYRKKGRWSANIKTITDESIEADANSSFFGTTQLCINPFQNDNSVSQQYTVKNIELSYEIESGFVDNIEGLTAYIMFVPQGMAVTETYPNNHPEYIMAYRFLGSPNFENNLDVGGAQVGRLPSKIKTRLARRLQTGDSIIFLIVGYNQRSNAATIKVNGLLRWWTKAN